MAATAKVAAAGVDVAGPPMEITARVAGDGRLNGVRIVRSSGSAETDLKAAQALRRLRVANPPILLVGADVKVAVGQPPLAPALGVP